MTADLAAAFAGRSVLVTGHTGFKGSWLSLWLSELGARVTGLALAPETEPSLFDAADVVTVLERHVVSDVRDRAVVAEVVREAAPDVVLHLAARTVVREGYARPAEAFSVNVDGTTALLDAVRLLDRDCAVVVVTSDKCYRDVSQGRRMREDDALGGKDPYSASKAAQELVAASYRAIGPAAIATARAGNVIGGGDCAADRIVPDAIRATRANAPLVVRNPDAVRPWQHVLNPLSGYLMLAERLLAGEAAEAWNFGPDAADERPVSDLVERLARRWPFEVRVQHDSGQEAPVLRLDSTKARERLGWAPRWDLETAIEAIVEWYAGSPREATLSQIAAYSRERDQTPTGR